MATVVSVILQCFTVFVATVAVCSLSWTVALRHYLPRALGLALLGQKKCAVGIKGIGTELKIPCS